MVRKKSKWIWRKFQYQLLSDLYFSSLNQKEMDELDGAKGSFGLCASYYGRNKGLIFAVYVRKDLDIDAFLNAFCDEFYHYCIDKIIYKWLDPQITGKIPPLTTLVSEMLSHKACWDCKHLGSLNCWKHPRNPIQLPIDKSLDDEALYKTALELREVIEKALENCLFIKMYNVDDFEDQLYRQLESSRILLGKLFSMISTKRK